MFCIIGLPLLVVNYRDRAVLSWDIWLLNFFIFSRNAFKSVPKVTLLFSSLITRGETIISWPSFAPSPSAPRAEQVTVHHSLHCSLPANSLSGNGSPFWGLRRSCQPWVSYSFVWECNKQKSPGEVYPYVAAVGGLAALHPVEIAVCTLPPSFQLGLELQRSAM